MRNGRQGPRAEDVSDCTVVPSTRGPGRCPRPLLPGDGPPHSLLRKTEKVKTRLLSQSGDYVVGCFLSLKNICFLNVSNMGLLGLRQSCDFQNVLLWILIPASDNSCVS